MNSDFRVDFMIIGAMKAGTSDLARKLGGHPGVCFCRIKEPHYFVRNPDWRNHMARYHSLFRPKAGQICGEASVSHSFPGEYPEVVDRLHDYNRDLKFIFLVRDPIHRIRSHYAHRLMHGIADKDPRKEISIRRSEYVNRSQYGRTLARYRDVFGPDRILTLMFDRYVQEPADTLSEILVFLGLPHEDLTHISARHSSTGSNRTRWSPVFYLDHVLAFSPPFARRILSRWISVKLREKPSLPDDLALSLWTELEPDVDLFADLSGLDVSAWRSRWTANRRS